MAYLTSSNTSGYYDPRYWGSQAEYEHEQRRRYEEMERQRYAAMQQQAYDPYRQMQGQLTDQQIQEGKKPKAAPTPEYLKNDKLLLLEK